MFSHRGQQWNKHTVDFAYSLLSNTASSLALFYSCLFRLLGLCYLNLLIRKTCLSLAELGRWAWFIEEPLWLSFHRSMQVWPCPNALARHSFTSSFILFFFFICTLIKGEKQIKIKIIDVFTSDKSELQEQKNKNKNAITIQLNVQCPHHVHTRPSCLPLSAD